MTTARTKHKAEARALLGAGDVFQVYQWVRVSRNLEQVMADAGRLDRAIYWSKVRADLQEALDERN